jgi:hypothetical protein
MKRYLGWLAVAVAAIAMVESAFAQRDAGSKIQGEYNFYGRSGGSAMRSAREHSTYYREYAQPAPKVNPEVAKEAADTIGDYITKAQKHMASMRKHAKASNDKETLASLDSIDKHLADAAKSHDEMRETCMKDTVDGKATLACCKVVDDNLAKAISEHDKLMKRLAGDKANTKK